MTLPAPPSAYGGPSDEKSVLTPSTVRENVPIVRKQAATFHNYSTALPPSRPVLFEAARTAPVFAFPQQGYFPEPVKARMVSNTNEPFNGLNFAFQPPNLVPTGYLPPQINLPGETNTNNGNSLIHQVSNEPVFNARTNYPPAFPRIEQINKQSYIQNVLPTVVPQDNSSLSISSNINNAPSQIFIQNGVQPAQPVPQSVDSYAQRTIDSIKN